MGSKNVQELQQSRGDAILSGCWKLAPGRAISLQPREAGVLRIAQGQVWATVDGPHQGRGNELGDHFLQVGQQLDVRAGQRLVFEAWGRTGAMPVCFEWTPVGTAVLENTTRWNAAVTQPLHDLGLALSQSLSARPRSARMARVRPSMLIP